uniref:Uncharacterized protein n=1 Tax=Anguilla anguilla TaxID=7936 RepID=A0A0E9SPA2_ANGAN
MTALRTGSSTVKQCLAAVIAAGLHNRNAQKDEEKAHVARTQRLMDLLKRFVFIAPEQEKAPLGLIIQWHCMSTV